MQVRWFAGVWISEVTLVRRRCTSACSKRPTSTLTLPNEWSASIQNSFTISTSTTDSTVTLSGRLNAVKIQLIELHINAQSDATFCSLRVEELRQNHFLYKTYYPVEDNYYPKLHKLELAWSSVTQYSTSKKELVSLKCHLSNSAILDWLWLLSKKDLISYTSLVLTPKNMKLCHVMPFKIREEI